MKNKTRKRPAPKRPTQIAFRIRQHAFDNLLRIEQQTGIPREWVCNAALASVGLDAIEREIKIVADERVAALRAGNKTPAEGPGN